MSLTPSTTSPARSLAASAAVGALLVALLAGCSASSGSADNCGPDGCSDVADGGNRPERDSGRNDTSPGPDGTEDIGDGSASDAIPGDAELDGSADAAPDGDTVEAPDVPVIPPGECDPRLCEEFGTDRPTDTDGDGIADCREPETDRDGDSEASCIDLDSDNDTIPDRWEGTRDTDSDGTPDRLDLDSDGDGLPDSLEGPPFNADGSPADTDGDGRYDFIDQDSDNDGIPDSDEPGCPAGPDRLLVDTDSDGWTDVLEVATGTNACDATEDPSSVIDFFFELPYLGPEQSDELAFGTEPGALDVVFNMDTTASMGGAIENLRTGLSGTIAPGVRALRPDTAFGVTEFRDYPIDQFLFIRPCSADPGSQIDFPFRLLQRVTSDIAAVQLATGSWVPAGGGDLPETGYASLALIATGAADTTCRSASVPAFNPAINSIPGIADGVIGGVGFRAGSLPVVVHITDDESQARGRRGFNKGPTEAEAMDTVNTIGARVITILNANNPSGNVLGDALRMTTDTGALVPACAWGATRPAGCTPDQCCTGRQGAGQAPGADGLCPLLFRAPIDGTGIGEQVVSGINTLVDFAPTDVTIRVRRDETEFVTSGIDTALFIDRVVPLRVETPSSACSSPLPPAAFDSDGDGVDDAFQNVTPGSTVFFDVIAQNSHVESTDSPQLFEAFIDVLGNGVALLDTQRVSIIVPPQVKE